MFWKKPRKQYHADAYEKNRLDQKRIVDEGVVPGILAYVDGQPAGWCGFEPRENYPALSRSRILKPIDDQPVWSVTCFFVGKKFRKQGVTVALLKEVLKFVSVKGSRIVEGYPVEVVGDKVPAPFIFTGTATAFKQAGLVRLHAGQPHALYFVT